MRVVIQRVTEASVAVDYEITGKIGPGLLVLAGFEESDAEAAISTGWPARSSGCACSPMTRA